MTNAPLGSVDDWNDQRAIDYLQNFWEPQLGSQMLYDGKCATISYVEEEFPEQISLNDEKEIHFVQDIDWFPKMSEIFGIFKKLGIRVHDDSISYNRIFKNKPNTVIEAAQLLVDLRVVSMLRPDTALGL